MHLQWREYELKNRERSLRAEVVKSYRDKVSGQPRNKAIGYLGSIRESNIKYALARRYFWWQVQAKLARLLISAADKAKIVGAISERVPF